LLLISDSVFYWVDINLCLSGLLTNVHNDVILNFSINRLMPNGLLILYPFKWSRWTISLQIYNIKPWAVKYCYGISIYIFSLYLNWVSIIVVCCWYRFLATTLTPTPIVAQYNFVLTDCTLLKRLCQLTQCLEHGNLSLFLYFSCENKLILIKFLCKSYEFPMF
jgi:hypothetical protein